MQLHEELRREFDKLSSDEYEDDPDDTENSTHYNFGKSFQNGHNIHKDFPLRNDQASLRNIVEAKDQEIEKISTLLINERKMHKSAIAELEKRLTIAESEKERVSNGIP